MNFKFIAIFISLSPASSSGLASEKTFKEQQNVFTFRMSAICLAFGFLYN